MKKLIFGIGAVMSLFLTSCEQGSSARYAAINRQRAIILVDQQTGEVFMMNLITEKGKGVVGSEWKHMGSPSKAK